MAAVVQLVERLPSKEKVAGSNPVRRSKMTNKLLNYLTIILFLIPFTLLIVDNKVLFPFITTKAITFRILVTIGLSLAAWLYLLNPNSFPKKNYLFWAIVFFFFANILATIFSVNPYRSFWGNAERMEGLWSLFFYLAYFFLLFTLFQFKPESRKIIFYSILIVTTSISLIEINQAFILKAERPSATLGNPTYIGFLNLLTIFLILYFLFEEFRDKENLSIKVFLKQLTENIFLKAILIILIFLNFISLLASQTRGSILGLLAGIFAFVVFYLIFSKTSYHKKILIFTLILLFLVGFFFFLKTPLALEIPGIKRIAETLQNPSSVFPRIFAWKIFLNAFKERPIFGYGPETMPIAFFKNFDPEIYKYEQAIFDRPHNKFIEVLASTGIVGFITWLLIFFAFIFYLLKQNINLLQKSSLFAFVIAYLAQNFSLFDMQASYLLFFFGLSLVTPKVEIKHKDLFIRPYLILVFGLSFLLLIFHFQHFYVVRKIISNITKPDPNAAVDEFVRLSEIAGPFLSEYANVTGNYFMNKLKEIKDFNTLIDFFSIVEKAYNKDPLDYKLAIGNYLRLLFILIDVKKQAGLDTKEDILKTERVFKTLRDYYPDNYEIYPLYASFLINQGKIEKAKEILQKGEKNTTFPSQYFFNEAYLYLNLKENQIALEKLKKAFEKGFQPQTDNDFQIVLKIYLTNNDVENSKKIISQWLSKNNSTSTKEIIIQILKEYNHQGLLKLDK